MKKLIITSNEVGEEYLNALSEVIKIRAERRKAYGDGYLKDPIDFDVWMLYGKLGRMLYIFKNGITVYEKFRDVFVDICNYSIFALTKLKKDKKHAIKIS